MTPSRDALDNAVRLRTFQWLASMVERHGEVLPRDLLLRGLEFQGQRIPLVSPQGIFKPRLLDLPLTITTVFDGPYDDSYLPERYLLYKYLGTDHHHRDNLGLRACLERRLPLAYFYGIAAGKYLALWPVYIVGDDPASHTFRVAVDDVGMVIGPSAQAGVGEENTARREYITTTAKRRLHQHSFREMVIRAYRQQCALCRLRHAELLDAAHIIPDSDQRGHARVDNGISLYKLHHAAFDKMILGITPDFQIEIRKDILEEEDGPMLQHGLKGLHRQRILLPCLAEQKPNREYLEERYQRFLGVG